MKPTYRLELLTPEETVLDTQIVSLVAPGSEGYLGVLAHHAPLITTLIPGTLKLTYAGGRTEIFCVSGGFLEVSADHALVLADTIERLEEIDVTRAEQARDRARRRLQKRPEGLDVDRAEAALRRALARLRVVHDYAGT
jgi:F-type H+-transporting ATPase subunit epsilon